MSPPRSMFGRARPKAQRAGMAVIRTGWSIIFPAIGFGLSILAETYTELPVSQPWTGITIGALAYGLKKYWFPDTVV